MSAAYFCHISFPCCSGARVTFHILFQWLRVTILSAALVVAVPVRAEWFSFPSSGGVPARAGWLPSRGGEFLKRQQLVPVVFVLFSSGIEFRRQAGKNIVHQCVKFIENGNDALLLGKGRDGDFEI